MEAVPAQHRADLDNAVEHGVLCERARVQTQLVVMKVEVDQAKHELAEEKSRMFALLQEMEELRVTAWIESDRRFQAKEKKHRAESERKNMADQLAKALEGLAAAEKLVMIE